MSEPSSQSSSLSADLACLRRELEEKSVLVQSVRKELILSQITVLELQDTILQKETEKADAVSILGRVEHVLEEKINSLFELDRVLNERIAALQAALVAQKAAHDQIAQDLGQKLDAARRDLSAAQTMAAGYARDLTQTRDQLQRAEQALTAVRASFSWKLTSPLRALRRLLP